MAWQLRTHLFGSGTGEEASRGLSHSLLNACIPQPVSQLFTDNIGLFCTREVTGSLLDWAEKQPLQHIPVNSQLLCFLSSLDHSLIQQSIKKLIPQLDVLYSSYYLSQGVSAGTKDSATSHQEIFVPLSPSTAAIRRNGQKTLSLYSALKPKAQLPHRELTEAGAGDPSCSASPCTQPNILPRASLAHKPHRKLPETHSCSQLPSI